MSIQQIKSGVIADDAVTAGKILDDAVTENKIVNGAVTDAKLTLAANASAIKTALNVSGDAGIFAARAWVNFDGTANSNLSGTYARTSPSTTVTVTATAHGLIVGSSVNLDFTTGTGLDGIYTVVTVANANTFTVTTVASTTTSGNVTLLRNTIRASGNVSSITDNGTGDYTINFTTAMPDANYCVVATTTNNDNSTSTNRAIGVYSTTALGGENFTLVGSVRMLIQASNSTEIDQSMVCVAIFR